MTDYTIERRRIIQRLVKKMNSAQPPPLSDDYLAIASKYTGLHPKVLNEIESSEVFECQIDPVDRSVIYEKLVYFYTTRSKIPATYELFLSLYGLIPAYIDIGNFRKLLVKMGFVWKKVSPTQAVVIENPLVRFERYNYLKKIQIYRSTDADVYYIDEGSYYSTGNFRDPILSKEFNPDTLKKEWAKKVIYAVGPNGIHALEDIKDFNCEAVEKWVRDSLLPIIPKPGVFVINNIEHHNEKLLETPTLNSLKKDIKLWLDRHEITYDPNMSKYELFALAEKYTDLNKTFFKIDEMIKSKGHKVLRIPVCIQNIRASVLLARVIDVSFPDILEEEIISHSIDRDIATGLFKEFMLRAGLLYTEDLENYVSMKEKELIKMEDNVDQVYDMLMAKHGSKTKETNEDSDLPSCTDSE